MAGSAAQQHEDDRLGGRAFAQSLLRVDLSSHHAGQTRRQRPNGTRLQDSATERSEGRLETASDQRDIALPFESRPRCTRAVDERTAPSDCVNPPPVANTIVRLDMANSRVSGFMTNRPLGKSYPFYRRLSMGSCGVGSLFRMVWSIRSAQGVQVGGSRMSVSRVACICALFVTWIASGDVRADDAAKVLAAQVIERAGGEAKLLKLFRMREQVHITNKPLPTPAADAKENRVSIVEVGGDWWLTGKPRGKDKVRVLCWAWSLRLLLAPNARLSTLPETEVAGKPSVGLKVEGATKDPVDLWFEKETMSLVAIDYTDTRHVFSHWTETSAGHRYAAEVHGYRFANVAEKKTSETQWYQSHILELTPLDELPEELKKK